MKISEESVKRVLSGLSLVSLLCVVAACGDDRESAVQMTETPTATQTPPVSTPTTEVQTPTATRPSTEIPTPTKTETPIPVQPGSVGASMAAIDLIDTAGFHDMANQLATADSLSRMGVALAVMAAQDIIDSQGFHAMEEELAAAQSFDDVSSRNLGRVEKALNVSIAAPLPEAVAAELEVFQTDAQALIDALVAEDLPAAQAAADAVHSSQHALSGAAFEWLRTQQGDPADDLVAAVGVMAAQDIIDTQGFHAMAEELAAAQSFDDVSARNLGRVEKALDVSMVGFYPAAVAAELAVFQTDAQALIDALVAEDLPAAQAAADAIHGSQHALSNAAFDLLDMQEGETNIGLLLVLGVMTAQDIIDSQGFHAMEEELAAAQSFDDVSSRNLGRVEKALNVSIAAPLPEAVAAELEVFQTDAQALIDALVAEDLPAAQAAADAIHGSQHALSNAAFDWLATQDGGQLMENLINSRFLVTVERILAASGATLWDAQVEDEVEVFMGDLEALRAALESGDTSAAAQASDAVHGSQHALSNAVYDWLQAQERTVSDAGGVMAAQDIIDSQGFHAIEEEIAAAQSIDDVSPRIQGRVENALTASRTVAWPAQVAAEAEIFEGDAEALITALGTGDLPAAQAAADAAHGSQHALSNATYAWLAEIGMPGVSTRTPTTTQSAGVPSPTATSTPTSPPSTPATPVTDVSYANDVHPIWTARTCNGCHRGVDATGGLVLDGDPASIYPMIVPEQVDLAEPANSRILLKPLATSAGGISHGGGYMFADTSDPDYQTILQWIVEGAQDN